jgi:Fe-S-cluster formation regulator IscX/YfhJ
MENIVKSLEGIYDGHKYCSYLENILDKWIDERYIVPIYS